MKPAKARGELALGKYHRRLGAGGVSLLRLDEGRRGGHSGAERCQTSHKLKPTGVSQFPPGTTFWVEKDRERKCRVIIKHFIFLYFCDLHGKKVCIKQYICTNLFLCFLVREMNSWPFWCWSKVRGKDEEGTLPQLLFSEAHLKKNKTTQTERWQGEAVRLCLLPPSSNPSFFLTFFLAAAGVAPLFFFHVVRGQRPQQNYC